MNLEYMRNEIPDELYIPSDEKGLRGGRRGVRASSSDPNASTHSGEVIAVDLIVPMDDLRTLDYEIEISLPTEGLLATLSSVCIARPATGRPGIYGVMFFMVRRWMCDIGIRMALGARHRSVVSIVLREILKLGRIGMAVGLASVRRSDSLAAVGVAPANSETEDSYPDDSTPVGHVRAEWLGIHDSSMTRSSMRASMWGHLSSPIPA